MTIEFLSQLRVSRSRDGLIRVDATQL